MKTYCITIEPASPFGTPLKGDTLFGQFCWQAAYDQALLLCPFEQAVEQYPERPFAVFSSAFPALQGGGFALKRPDAPLDLLFNLSGKSKEEIIGNRKAIKKQKWLVCERQAALANLQACNYLDDQGLTSAAGLDPEEYTAISTVAETGHNSISRLTGTTGPDGFAPFTQRSTFYAPGCKLVLFVGIDETMLSVDNLVAGLARIGQGGFGRDASTGLGKFSVASCTVVDLPALGAPQPNALYTLAPCVPDTEQYVDALFSPFTRFGRHGDRLATSGKPFKNPVVMADEGALLFPRSMPDACDRPYLGSAVTGVSKIQSTAVAQGYSLYIPVRLEV